MRCLAVSLIAAAAPPPVVRRAISPLERIFASPALSGPTPRLPKLSPDGRFVDPAEEPRRTTRPLRSVGDRHRDRRRADAGRFRRRSAPAARSPKRRRCAASARASPAPRASPNTNGRRTASRSSSRSTATSISPTLDGSVRRLTNTPATEIDAQGLGDRPLSLFPARPESLSSSTLATGTRARADQRRRRAR